MTELNTLRARWSMHDYCMSWRSALRAAGIRLDRARTHSSSHEMQLYRPPHGSEPAVAIILRMLSSAEQPRILMRVRLSQYSIVCIATGAALGVSVAQRSATASSDLLHTYPILADTMRRIATAARAWTEQQLRSQSVEERVNSLLQYSDTGGTLPVAVSDTLLTCSVLNAQTVQLALDLG
jgi:hypothetical protein